MSAQPAPLADEPASGRARARQPLHRSLYAQVIVAIVVGCILGWLAPELAVALKPVGDGFIKLVKMMIAPIIFCTVVTGIGGTNDLRRIGRVGGKALLYFTACSTLALVLGLVVGNVLQPGRGLHADPATLDASAIASYQAEPAHQSLSAFLLHIVPETALGALASGEILPVLLLSTLLGFGLALAGERGRRFHEVLQSVSSVVFAALRIIMKLAPLGALGAMAFTVGKYGIASLAHLAGLVGSFYLTSLLFVIGVLGAVARISGFRIIRLLRYLRGELLLVLGTSSSEAALPSLMQKLERAGVAQPVVGLVVPTGYSFNLDGTNIYMSMAALFLAQATDTPLSLADQLLLLLVAMVSSKGAAGVTGSGFVTLAATLSVVPSVPVGAMALLLGIDRFMSECRALTNFIGNAVATIVIARWERAVDMDQLRLALRER